MVTHLQFPFHFWSSWHRSPRCQKPSCPVLAGLLLLLRCVHAPAGCNSLVEQVKLASVDMRLWFWRGSEVTPHPLLGACGGNRFMWGGNDLLLALNWSAVNAAPQAVVLVRRKPPQVHCAVAAPGEKSWGNSRSYVLLTATGLPPPKGIAQIPVDIWKAPGRSPGKFSSKGTPLHTRAPLLHPHPKGKVVAAAALRVLLQLNIYLP